MVTEVKNRVVFISVMIAIFFCEINASENAIVGTILELNVRFKEHVFISNKERDTKSWFDDHRKKLKNLGWACPDITTYVRVEWLCRDHNNQERHWLTSRLLIAKNAIAGAYKNNKLGVRKLINMLMYNPLPEYVSYEYLKNNREEYASRFINLTAYDSALRAQWFDDYDMCANHWSPANNAVPLSVFISSFIYDCASELMRGVLYFVGGTVIFGIVISGIFYCCIVLMA